MREREPRAHLSVGLACVIMHDVFPSSAVPGVTETGYSNKNYTPRARCTLLRIDSVLTGASATETKPFFLQQVYINLRPV